MAAEPRVMDKKDLKMGRSKFPGKPSKGLSRRRVNLIKCERPMDNESSFAAESICHGLTVFNQTFGPNEVLDSEDFKGFSTKEVEEALAKAAMQQKEAEAEMKMNGIVVNLRTEFEEELSSIFCSESNVFTSETKSTLCFDGGGRLDIKDNVVNTTRNVNRQKSPSRLTFKNNIEAVETNKVPLQNETGQIVLRSSTSKSLQSQAAKKLLKRAKKVTIVDSSKKTLEKKFVLPIRSARSSRVIKPNKKFIEDSISKADTKVKTSIEDDIKTETSPPPRPAGRIILREARLQLESAPQILREGPFSSPIPKRRTNLVSCGVCGSVRFYKGVKQATKFGILSCDSCRKFIAKMIKSRTSLQSGSLRCVQGAGLCMMPAVVRSADGCSRLSGAARCQACWLKLCLRHFLLPEKIKTRLLSLLPAEIRPDMPHLHSRSDKNIFPITESRLTFFDSFTKPNDINGLDKSLVRKEDRIKRGKKEASKKKGDNRQRQPIGGPRVKHVCRSASVVLGQPIATFPEKPSAPVECCQDSPPSPQVVLVPTNPPPVPVEEQSKPSSLTKAACQPKPAATVAHVSALGRKKKTPPTPAENMLSMDFWENYDPDEVCETGFSLIGSEPFTIRSLCYLCGSAGFERMIHCACCCEPFHDFCVGEAASSDWKWDWVCPRCTICAACGRASGQQLTCSRCDNSYHTECVGGRLHHSPDRPWVCSACLRCKSCNATDVSVFVGNLPLCKPCFVLRQKGNFCPLCQRCYEDDDYDCKMMECGGCQSWVHAKCEGLSDEKYQVLSYLPESVEFVCRMCCTLPPAAWWLAIEAELREGYLMVLKALSKNRTACQMLKWSPKKICSCRRRESLKQIEEEAVIPEGDRSPHPTSDSGLGSTDDEVRGPIDDDTCFCFLEVDSYNSRSKPFSIDLLRIRKKVMDCEYSSLSQFHEDMRAMMETAQSNELMEVYHQAMKEVFPWFDPRGARVTGASRGGSLENTPIKASPVKKSNPLPSLVPSATFKEKPLDYFYQHEALPDTRMCLFCKGIGDSPAISAGRLLYLGQNEWVHCNCALWSSEVFEEIDGSLQNVHSAVSRGRGIRCPHCQLKGASIGCCARNCAETYHFLCAKAAGCVFLEDKSVYCHSHVGESAGRQLEGEKGFELRRPVYVELDKRRSKPVEVHNVKLVVGALRVESLGRFIPDLSDLSETIMPADFSAVRIFWSAHEPWRLCRYKFSVRLIEPEQEIGVDLGVNLTIDHCKPDIESKLKALRHFQIHSTLPPDFPPPQSRRRKRRLPELLDEPDNQELLPPDIEEAILKELSHDMLEGISVQDIFQDINERDEMDDDWMSRVPGRKSVTLRTGNWNAKVEKEKADAKWKRKVQEGKENKMFGWCARLLQVDGAIDSSSGSEAGESPGRSVDLPVDIPDIPQLDGAEDSDYESCDGMPEAEESPVECEKCRCTYRTQKSYERHLQNRCHELLLSSSDDDEEPSLPAPPPPPKPPKPRTYARRKPPESVRAPMNVNNSPSTPILMATPVVPPPPQPNHVPVLVQEMPYQPVMQYIMEPQKPVIMPNSYQVVLPSSPMVLGQAPGGPIFEVVTDPHTGGVFLAQAQPSPQPMLYNMETIVSNTVMQTNQFMSASFSQTSTQVFQASKQVVNMNMPTGYMIAPNDLICVPVQAMAQPPMQPNITPQMASINSNWATVKTPKAQPSVVKPETPIRAQPVKQKQRSRALVDFINNFKIDSADLQEPVQPSPKAVPLSKKGYSPVIQKETITQVARPLLSNIVAPPLPKISRPSPAPPQKITISPVARPVRPSQPYPSPVDIQCFPKTPPTMPPSTLPRTPCAAPFVPLPPQLGTLNISMPSLEDSPPVSCDNSPVPIHPISTIAQSSLSPQTNLMSKAPEKLFSPPLRLPPSPFLSPNSAPSFTPPQIRHSPTQLPSPSSATSPKSHLPVLTTCNALPPIENHLTDIHSFEMGAKIPRKMYSSPPHATAVTPPKIEFLNASHSPLKLQPPRIPPSIASPNLAETQPLPETASCPDIVVKAKESKQPSRTSTNSVLLPIAEPQKLASPRLPETAKEIKAVQSAQRTEGPVLVYDVVTDDGFKVSSSSLSEIFQKISESIQEMRKAYRMPPVPMGSRSFELFGMKNHGLQHLLEQLPGAGNCKRYQPKYFKQLRTTDDDLSPVKENASGCARSEEFSDRKEVDKFGWLASRHRKVPRVADASEETTSNRKTTNLPMAMRYRALRESSKTELFVYRSKIHGMGLFCTREIDAGEMVIEYSGQLIRSSLTDKREKLYTDKGIGCYMFRIDDHWVIDATMNGNSARFINHSCEPNCYSKVVDILGRKHIIIFALRRISVMEELTYDYKFPIEDVKIFCHCQSKKCRKYLN